MNNEYVKGYKTYEDFQIGYEKFKNKLEKMTGGSAEQFVREYELYREGISNRFYYGTLYRVVVQLTDEGIEAGVINELCGENRLISMYENMLTLLWEVPANEGLYEIEIEMHYILKDTLYGKYSIEECVLADFANIE